MNDNRRSKIAASSEVKVVDLGLPSGTLWATGNLAKDANGNYYIGEPWEAGCYVRSGYIDGYNEGEAHSESELFSYGDLPTNDPNYDISTARLGSPYRNPTTNDLTELKNNTTSVWYNNYQSSGMPGRLFTSKINGQSVFFPCAGVLASGGTVMWTDSGRYNGTTRSGASRKALIIMQNYEPFIGDNSYGNKNTVRPLIKP